MLQYLGAPCKVPLGSLFRPEPAGGHPALEFSAPFLCRLIWIFTMSLEYLLSCCARVNNRRIPYTVPEFWLCSVLCSHARTQRLRAGSRGVRDPCSGPCLPPGHSAYPKGKATFLCYLISEATPLLLLALLIWASDTAPAAWRAADVGRRCPRTPLTPSPAGSRHRSGQERPS